MEIEMENSIDIDKVVSEDEISEEEVPLIDKRYVKSTNQTQKVNNFLENYSNLFLGEKCHKIGKQYFLSDVLSYSINYTWKNQTKSSRNIELVKTTDLSKFVEYDRTIIGKTKQDPVFSIFKKCHSIKTK